MVRQSVKGVYLLRNRVMRVMTILRAGGFGLLGLAAVCGLTGFFCKQKTAYEIPKEDYAIRTASTRDGHAHSQARPNVKWTLPEGWTEKSGQQQMGVGAFRIEGEGEKYADVRIIPLKAGPEIEKHSINIWREELGLAELPIDQIHGDELDIPGVHAHLYDMTSAESRFAGKFKARTTGAVLERDNTPWFVKMIGEESVVASQQDVFREFLKSLKFE